MYLSKFIYMYVYVYVYVSIYIYINKNKSKYLPTPREPGGARPRSNAKYAKSEGRFEASFSSVQKVAFGILGYGQRARSVLHCHGVLPLRHRPWTRAVPDESKQAGSQQCRKASKLKVWR